MWPHMETAARTEQFVRRLTACQSRLYGFIVSMLGDLDRAHDVLQECNVVLWQKAAEYDHDRDFVKWACGFAYQQVLAHRRDAGRDRLVLSDAVLARMAARMSREPEEAHDVRRRALAGCMKQLRGEHQQLLWQRYGDGGSVQRIASETGKTPAAVSQILARLRRSLLECIERKLGASGGGA